MKCPYCGKIDSEVIETRASEDLGSIRRRRECSLCKKRFTTYERVENVELLVVKKDGRREAFSRDKLRMGILKACEKRPVSGETANEIVDSIERELRGEDSIEVTSRKIGNMALSKLKMVDKVAYLRFASVYLDFKDLSDFEEMIDKLS
jgi:transcriptional repressor NrdR